MATAAIEIVTDHSSSDTPLGAPVVIIGNGPAGMRAAREIIERIPEQSVIIYGEEPHQPYNRVRLSSWLAGELDLGSLSQPAQMPADALFIERIGYRISAIDSVYKHVTDNTGYRQHYAKLILATGSSPFIPNIKGIEKEGVFTFRDLDDTNRLLARRARSHHTVVLGGGLLGLEAARGMQPGNTKVTVIEHADRLLSRQLDESASDMLRQEVQGLSIELLIGDGVTAIEGNERVQSVQLRSGRTLECDTVILATGIKPNIQLASDTSLAFNRGVRVDDHMQTSDKDIYAIGECAEHRGTVYGLVGPGLEHAAVAAAHIAGAVGDYKGSVAASRLKVVGTQVFSMGPMGADANPSYGSNYVYRDNKAGVYRKILLHRNRLVGAIGIGDWSETVRLQTLIGRRALIWPWQIIRFRRTGGLWPQDDSQGVASWPAAAVICQCTGVTRGTITEAIACGARSTDAVSEATGASTVCGSCKPLVQDLLGNSAEVKPVALYKTLAVSAVLAFVAALLFLIGPTIPYPDSVQVNWRWDQLWRNGLWKQISGFTVLGLFAVGLLISLRKRTRLAQHWGKFDGWRLMHIGLGLLVIVALVAHTGLRLGTGLNLLLMGGFSLMLLLGAVSSGVIALEHRIGGSLARRLRRQSVLMHILLFWPVPALLGWHVFKTYWY